MNKTPRLPQEQPPTNNNTWLAEWLTRLVILINGNSDEMERHYQEQIDALEARVAALEVHHP